MNKKPTTPRTTGKSRTTRPPRVATPGQKMTLHDFFKVHLLNHTFLKHLQTACTIAAHSFARSRVTTRCPRNT